MRIRFTVDPKLPRDLLHLGYRRDMEVDLPQDQADKWLHRGVAELVETPVAVDPEPEAAPKLVIEIPNDWETQHHMSRLSLARRLTDAPVENAADADAVINAELDRRTKPD